MKKNYLLLLTLLALPLAVNAVDAISKTLEHLLTRNPIQIKNHDEEYENAEQEIKELIEKYNPHKTPTLEKPESKAEPEEKDDFKLFLKERNNFFKQEMHPIKPIADVPQTAFGTFGTGNNRIFCHLEQNQQDNPSQPVLCLINNSNKTFQIKIILKDLWENIYAKDTEKTPGHLLQSGHLITNLSYNVVNKQKQQTLLVPELSLSTLENNRSLINITYFDKNKAKNNNFYAIIFVITHAGYYKVFFMKNDGKEMDADTAFSFLEYNF